MHKKNRPQTTRVTKAIVSRGPAEAILYYAGSTTRLQLNPSRLTVGGVKRQIWATGRNVRARDIVFPWKLR